MHRVVSHTHTMKLDVLLLCVILSIFYRYSVTLVQVHACMLTKLRECIEVGLFPCPPQLVLIVIESSQYIEYIESVYALKQPVCCIVTESQKLPLLRPSLNTPQ